MALGKEERISHVAYFDLGFGRLFSFELGDLLRSRARRITTSRRAALFNPLQSRLVLLTKYVVHVTIRQELLKIALQCTNRVVRKVARGQSAFMYIVFSPKTIPSRSLKSARGPHSPTLLSYRPSTTPRVGILGLRC